MYKFVVSIFFFCIAITGAARADTWLFAAAACPPWKEIPDKPDETKAMAAACALDVANIVDAFQPLWQIPDNKIIQLVDAQATGPNISKALGLLAQQAKPDDRVILYINTHGGAIDALYAGYQTKDEVLAWYTDEEPTDFKAATQDGRWMTVRALRDKINMIAAEEIILIIEACHAAFSLDDFINNVHDGIGGRGEDWPGREAVLFSAHANQIANFTPDHSKALFTDTFASILRSGDKNTFLDAFEAARMSTHRKVRENCAKDHTHKELVQGWSSYKLMCTQMPQSWDPFGLLDDISVKTAKSFGSR